MDNGSFCMNLNKTAVVQKHKLSSETCSWTSVGMQPYQGQLTKKNINKYVTQINT